jgi:ABC-type Zn uptake system ZnuABC Zn-binding protein ZnuA
MKILSRNINWKIFLSLFFSFWLQTNLVFAQKIRIITTIPDLADITKQIGKDLVDVESLARGVEFMHAGFQPF